VNKGKGAKGAFHPMALKLYNWQKYGEKKLVPVTSKKEILDALEGYDFTHLTFFGHGYKHRIQYFRKTEMPEFIERLPLQCEQVTLFSCNCAKGPNNIARKIFTDHSKRQLDEQMFTDFGVVGHYTAGHTVYNPCVKKYSSFHIPALWGRNENKGYQRGTLSWSWHVNAFKKPVNVFDILIDKF
jgi:hypothetical protein